MVLLSNWIPISEFFASIAHDVKQLNEAKSALRSSAMQEILRSMFRDRSVLCFG
jgi:hypothetical protein